MPAFTNHRIAAAVFTTLARAAVLAADGSDTSRGYRHGTQFAGPFNANDIAKNILNPNHASGFKYGSNCFKADVLLSNNKDPAGAGSTNGAQEIDIVYRQTLDLAKTRGAPMTFGPVRGIGLTSGFDLNTKTHAAAGNSAGQPGTLRAVHEVFAVMALLTGAAALAAWQMKPPAKAA